MGSRRNEADDIIPGQIELKDYLRGNIRSGRGAGAGNVPAGHAFIGGQKDAHTDPAGMTTGRR